MPEEPSEETFLHHQPLDSRPTVVRPRLSRGWEYDFYPDRIAKESEPATVVLCDGSGIRCISGSRAATTPKSAVTRLAHDTHPQGGSVAGLWRKKLCQEPPGGTALRAFDFDMAISDTLDRTYVPDKGLRRLRQERNVFRASLARTGHALLVHFGTDRPGSGCHHFDDAFRCQIPRSANSCFRPRS